MRRIDLIQRIAERVVDAEQRLGDPQPLNAQARACIIAEDVRMTAIAERMADLRVQLELLIDEAKSRAEDFQARMEKLQPELAEPARYVLDPQSLTYRLILDEIKVAKPPAWVAEMLQDMNNENPQ